MIEIRSNKYGYDFRLGCVADPWKLYPVPTWATFSGKEVLTNGNLGSTF